MRRALRDGLFVGLHHQFGMLRLFVWIINTCKVLELACVSQPVETLHIALATDIDGTLDVHLNKIADLLAGPSASLAVRGDGGGNAGYSVAREQATDKSDTLDVRIAIFAAEAKPFAQMCAYDIAIEHLNLEFLLSQSLLNMPGKGTFAGAGEAGKPDSKACCHKNILTFHQYERLYYLCFVQAPFRIEVKVSEGSLA